MYMYIIVYADRHVKDNNIASTLLAPAALYVIQ